MNAWIIHCFVVSEKMAWTVVGELVVYVWALWSNGHRNRVFVLPRMGPSSWSRIPSTVCQQNSRFPLPYKSDCATKFFPCPQNQLEAETDPSRTRWKAIWRVSSLNNYCNAGCIYFEWVCVNQVTDSILSSGNNYPRLLIVVLSFIWGSFFNFKVIIVYYC